MNDFKDTLFIFTTTPAGLGHIRVMDAIKDGRPGHIASVDVGVTDIRSNRIHDLGSRVKAFVKLTEFYQTNPIAETIVTFFYTLWLKRHIKGVTDKFIEIAKQYPTYKKWVVVSTHFALAHSISSAKKNLEEKLGIKIYLCIIVTDDSPQKVWAVKNSDITFVPSENTKSRLAKFFPEEKRESIKAISFPLVQRFSQNLNTKEFEFVIDQLDPDKKAIAQIEIPISGAAVQLGFFEKFIQILCRENYSFTVIGQESMLTKMFFENMQKLPRVQLSIGADPWQTVNFYESIFYQPNRPSIEITKPSEQAFKAILNPRQRGGVILLLTPAIGRQERDNLEFLRRNALMPSVEENRQLFEEQDLINWKEKAKSWRAIELPEDPSKAAEFVKKLKSERILYAMLAAVIPNKPELYGDGVKRIWEEIEKLIA